MSAKPAIGIILAAGKGVRMKSDLPKALQKIAGVPMIRLIVDAMKGAGFARVVVVVGHGKEHIQAELGEDVEYAVQKEQLGTGHAVTMTRELLSDFDGSIVIAPGDAPLLDDKLFEFLLSVHGESTCTMPTAVVADPKGYGRIVRNAKGQLLRIVEEKDASPEIKAINEVNAGIYCFDSKSLYSALPLLTNTNAQREYYLTDLVEIMSGQGLAVKAEIYQDPEILVGVNDRWQLALAEKQLQRKILKELALSGVSLLDVESTYIGPYVKVAPGAIIEPGTVIFGRSEIGEGTTVGPNTRIDGCKIGKNCRVYMSHLQSAILGDGVNCGPFANIRPESVLDDHVKVGSFVELKKAHLSRDVSVGHLAYIGDAEVGSNTNIGAGAVTCNYDGNTKHRTSIGADVFVGSNTTLVAPLTIEDRVIIAAGSTITSDVPSDAGAFGRARQETKIGWATKWRLKIGSSK